MVLKLDGSLGGQGPAFFPVVLQRDLIDDELDVRVPQRLEKALDLEAESPPEVIDLHQARIDYGALLAQYQGLVDAMVVLKIVPPPDFASRVIRAADEFFPERLDLQAIDADDAAAFVHQVMRKRVPGGSHADDEHVFPVVRKCVRPADI